jgi:hypothetical protein
MTDAAKFRQVPKLEEFKIPFKLEENALTDWLTDLASEDAEEACARILTLLQSFNKTDLVFKQRFTLLQIIQEYLKQYINRLDHSCWEAGFPLSDDEVFYAEIIAWNYLFLGEGFFITAKHANKKPDAVLSLAKALQVIGQAQLHIAATYSTPHDGFWRSLYRIFAWAEQKKLQDLAIDSNEFKNLTVNTLFARCLIFQLCDTNQFHAKEMRTVFDFLPKVCGHFPISIFFNSDHGMSFIDLDSDNPPLNVKQQTEIGSTLVRYFSPVVVANALNRIIENGEAWSGALKSINNTLFGRVAKTLGLQQKRQYMRKKENQSLFGVIGFDDIIGFLYKTTQNKPIQPAPKAPTLKKAGEFADKAPIDAPTKKVSLQEITIYDSSANGYSVSWDQHQTKTKIGDLFGLISDDRKRLEIAIIRRIVLNDEKDAQHNFRFGAELFGFESEIAYLNSVDPEKAGVWAIFIPGIELLATPDTIIFSTGHFSIGEHVYLHRKGQRTFTLLFRELHSTTKASHVELIYPKNQPH